MLSNLKAALAARRKRQADLAFALKILPGVLSEVINERREAPPALRRKIARALGRMKIGCSERKSRSQR